MFYDLNLLCPKRKGKFAIIWLAATRGIPFLKKNNVNSVNVAQVCTEILQFVMSDSRDTQRRLSLYLSAKLMYGTVLVYRHQLKTLETNLIFFSMTIKRPIFKFLPEDENRKKPTRKTPKRKIPKVTAPAQVDEMQIEDLLQVRNVPLPELNQNVTDPIHITMPEEQSTRIHNEAELFGDEGQIDLQIAQFEDISRLIPETDIPLIPPMVPGEDRSIQEKRLIDVVEDIEQSPSKRRRTEIRPVNPPVRVIEHGELSPDRQGQDRTLMPPPQSPARRSDRLSVRPEPVYPRDLPSPRPRRRTRIQWDPLYSPSNSEMGSFAQSDIAIRSQISRFLSPLQYPQIRDVERAISIDIIGDILRHISHTEEDIREVINMVSPTSKRKTRSKTQPDVPILPNIEIIEPEIVQEISRIQEQDIIPDVSLVPSPRVSRVQLAQATLDPIENLDDIRQQRLYTSTPITDFQTESKRHSVLLNRLRQLFDEFEGPLTMNIICEPLNRVNVARTFNGLLHLHAQRYVILKSSDDSIELKEIYPGPRL